MLYRFLISKGTNSFTMTFPQNSKQMRNAANAFKIDTPEHIMDAVADDLMGYQWDLTDDGQVMRYALFAEESSVFILQLYYPLSDWHNCPDYASMIDGSGNPTGEIIKSTLSHRDATEYVF